MNACGASANGKTRNLALAELPQRSKQKIWRLRSFRKWQNGKFEACGASANGKIENLMPNRRVCEGRFQNLMPNQRVCEGCFRNMTPNQRVCKGFSYVL